MNDWVWKPTPSSKNFKGVSSIYKSPGTIGGLPNLNITTILLYKRAGDLNMYVKFLT